MYDCFIAVFAYGATGAGKTFTMLGTPEHPGIAYLTIVELLKFIDQAADMKVTLGASYLEVDYSICFSIIYDYFKIVDSFII